MACTDVLLEPFINLSAWTNNGCTIAAGRTGTACQIVGNKDASYTIPAINESDTVTMGFAWRRIDANDGTLRDIVHFLSDAGSTQHVKLSFMPTNTLVVYRFSSITLATGTVTLATNTWYYIEVQVKLHDTTGFVKVRVNGTEVINATGDTRNGGTKTVFDSVRLVNSTTNASAEYDDLYISTGPDCTFKGNITISEMVVVDTFESGTDGAAIVAGTPWTVISGTPTYEADAAVHGSMGLRLDASGEYVRYTIPHASCSGSFYLRCRAVTTSANRFFAIQTSASVAYVQLRQHSNTTFSISDSANTQLGASTTLTWAAGDVFRIDWQATVTGVSPNVAVSLSVRFFKNANIEGLIPDETLTQGVTAQSGAVARVQFLSSAAGFVTDVDTVRHSTSLEWAGPYGTPPPAVPGTVVHVWSGTPTTTGFIVTAKTSLATSVRLAVSASSGMTSPTYFGPVVPDADGYVRFAITGLAAGDWWYQLADTPTGGSETLIGTPSASSTLPSGAVVASLKVALGACVQENQSGSANAAAAFNSIVAWQPDFMVHTGDFYYSASTSTSPSTYRALYDAQMVTVPGLATMMKNVPMFYCISDHECGLDNGDNDNAWNVAHRTAYQQVVPYAGGTTHYYAWTVGRVRFIMLDTRSPFRSHGADADTSAKTMLGATQKAWLFSELDRPELLKVIICDPGWIGTAALDQGTDKWWAYDTERQEIANYITSRRINVDLWNGDNHGLGVATGASNPRGGFPVLNSAPLLNIGGGRYTGLYDQYYINDQANEYRLYMRITITDDGDTITRTASGWDAASGVQRVSSVETWDAAGGWPVAIVQVGGGTVDGELYYYNGTEAVPVVAAAAVSA